MDQQQQSRWRTTGRRVLWAVIIGIALVVLFRLIRIGYAYHWTGFDQFKVDEHVQPAKTLWDWLSLLIVPFVLALGGYLFNKSENRRTLVQADHRREEDVLQAYLDQMRQLLLEKGQPLRQPKAENEARTAARVGTLTTLERIHHDDKKGIIVKFLSECSLLEKQGAAVSLEGANLRGAKLGGAQLCDADLSGADLRKADLSQALLRGADLSGANLAGANLSKSDLRSAEITEEQLAACKSLKEATMPNGQKYEDWFKSKDRKKDGKDE